MRYRRVVVRVAMLVSLTAAVLMAAECASLDSTKTGGHCMRIFTTGSRRLAFSIHCHRVLVASLLIAVLLSATSCGGTDSSQHSGDGQQSQEQSAHVSPYAVVVDGLGGYIDSRGSIIVEPQYEVALPFSEGLAGVRMDGLSGFIDETGKTVITPQFDNVGLGGFSEGRAAVQVGDQWGYIDTKGQMVVQAQFFSAGQFHEGLAAVSIEGQGQGYIDRQGSVVIEPKFMTAQGFSEGLAAASVMPDDTSDRIKYEFIDTSGRVVIEPGFTQAVGFSEGLAAVEVGDVWGFIDKTGHFVIEPQYELAGPFSGGLAFVAVGEKQGFIDKGGAMVIRPQYYHSGDGFSEGLAAVCAEPHDPGDWDAGPYGYVDQSGRMVIPPEFFMASPYRDGLASVFKGELGAAVNLYIDKTGKVVWSGAE